MKIRHGFVSNSSSSSFIVEVFDNTFYSKRMKRIITKEQEIKLKKFGFKVTREFCPDVFEAAIEEETKLKSENSVKRECGYYNYGYWIQCNQDDVIEFLLKNTIPFTASIHYRHYVMIYNGGDYFYTIPNFGNMIETHRKEDIEKKYTEIITYQKLLDKQLVKVYLNRNTKLSSAELLKKIVKKEE